MTFEDVKRIRQNPTLEDCDNEELSKLIDIALEKQIPKKPIHIHEEYEKHQWKKDKNGNIDLWAVSGGFCNGPMCERCFHSTCEHCNPNYDDEPCIVDKKICPTCSARLDGWGKPKYCDKCGQALDWSDTE